MTTQNSRVTYVVTISTKTESRVKNETTLEYNDYTRAVDWFRKQCSETADIATYLSYEFEIKLERVYDGESEVIKALSLKSVIN